MVLVLSPSRMFSGQGELSLSLKPLGLPSHLQSSSYCLWGWGSQVTEMTMTSISVYSVQGIYISDLPAILYSKQFGYMELSFWEAKWLTGGYTGSKWQCQDLNHRVAWLQSLYFLPASQGAGQIETLSDWSLGIWIVAPFIGEEKECTLLLTNGERPGCTKESQSIPGLCSFPRLLSPVHLSKTGFSALEICPAADSLFSPQHSLI